MDTRASHPRLTVFCLAALFAAAACGGSPPPPVWTPGPDLPVPVTNNAVVGVETAGGSVVFSLLGLDSTKAWDGVQNWAFSWRVGSDRWDPIAEVPGPGRLAATAQAWRGRVFLFGGYTVSEDGSEVSVPNLDIYDPGTGGWTAGAPIPVPVDDAVSGIWRDSLMVLVSGWHDGDNVAEVQLYDPRSDSWTSATPIPGAPVFGHSGAVAGDAIVYVDGARVTSGRPRFVVDTASWVGRFSTSGQDVHWERLALHPGPPLYRAAAVGWGDWVIFAGGTDNPYNYSGVGYDGRPAEPRDGVFGFHVPTGGWQGGAPLPEASMDHRALALTEHHVVLVGGMGAGQRVRTTVWVAERERLLRELAREDPRSPGKR